MKFLFKLLLAGFIAFMVVGCRGATPAPASSMPKWYLNETPSNSSYYYAVGVGSSKEDAKSIALSNVAGEISSTVQSAMELTSSDSTEAGYSEQSKMSVKSSTQSIKFTGVTVLNNAYAGGKFYTQLKVDKMVLFASQKRALDVEYKKLENLYKTDKSKGTFAVLKNYSSMIKSINDMLSKPTLAILKTINPSFKSMEYRAKIVAIKNGLNDIKANTTVFVKATNKLATHYKPIVVKYISAYGINIVNKRRDAKLVVELKVKARKRNVKTDDPRLKGASFANVTVTLVTKDKTKKVVAQNRISFINISKDGLRSAKIKVKKFEKKVRNAGILNILISK